MEDLANNRYNQLYKSSLEKIDFLDESCNIYLHFLKIKS